MTHILKDLIPHWSFTYLCFFMLRECVTGITTILSDTLTTWNLTHSSCSHSFSDVVYEVIWGCLNFEIIVGSTERILIIVSRLLSPDCPDITNIKVLCLGRGEGIVFLLLSHIRIPVSCQRGPPIVPWWRFFLKFLSFHKSQKQVHNIMPRDQYSGTSVFIINSLWNCEERWNPRGPNDEAFSLAGQCCDSYKFWQVQQVPSKH